MAMDTVMHGMWEISHGNMTKSLILGEWEAPPAILGVPPSEEVCSLKLDGTDFVEYIPA